MDTGNPFLPSEAEVKRLMHASMLDEMIVGGLSFTDCVEAFARKQGLKAQPYINAAKLFDIDDDRIAVDDTTIVSMNDDDGAYVMAWIWVRASDIDTDTD